MLRFLLLLLLSLLPLGRLHAHQIAEIQMGLTIDGNKLSGTMEIDAAYMLPEFRGDIQEDPKDLVWLREQGPAGWRKIEEAAKVYAKQCLRLEADGKEVPFELEIPAFREATPWFIRDGIPEDAPMVEATFKGELPPGARKLDAKWKEPYDVVLVVTIHQGGKVEMKPVVSGERMTLAQRELQAETKTGAPAEAQPETLVPVEFNLGDWIKFGFLHILPEGVDHILFVLGLFLLAPKWKPLLKQTIAFTIGHSISLAIASIGWIDVSSQDKRALIDILICASIVWIGVENLLVKELGKGRIALVAAFGMVHGMGFASQLVGKLPKGHPEQLPLPLFGFNLGVELAQIAVILIAFALVGWWKGEFKWIRRIGSGAVAAAGLALLVMGSVTYYKKQHARRPVAAEAKP